MKIVHIIPNLKKGGAERLVIDIVKELHTRQGIKVRLVLLHNEIDYEINHIKDVLFIIPATIRLFVFRKKELNIDALQNFINEFNPDIIHSHLFEAEVVSRSCYFPKAKWFSHCHDNMIQFENFRLKSFNSKSSITNYIDKSYLFKQYKKNGGTHFIAISNHTKKYFQKRVSNYPITLLNNAIKFFSFSRNDAVCSYTNKLKLINVGAFFFEKKNQLFLVQVAYELKHRGVNFDLHFLGDGVLRKSIEDKSVKLGLEKQVFFHGNVNNVEEFLWQSNVYVHSATYEPLGLVLIEAMAAGLPVVTLDGGGNRDLIEEGKNGFMIYEENVDLFVDKILLLWENKNEYKKISMYAKDFAKKFDIKEYVSRLLEIYAS